MPFLLLGTSLRLPTQSQTDACDIGHHHSPFKSCCFCFAAGEAITFYTEDDSWQLRSIVNVMRTAGCEVPDWMLHLKKERRKSHKKAGKQVDPLEQNQEQALKGAMGQGG